MSVFICSFSFSTLFSLWFMQQISVVCVRWTWFHWCCGWLRGFTRLWWAFSSREKMLTTTTTTTTMMMKTVMTYLVIQTRTHTSDFLPICSGYWHLKSVELWVLNVRCATTTGRRTCDQMVADLIPNRDTAACRLWGRLITPMFLCHWAV